jgi:hypothetical protein
MVGGWGRGKMQAGSRWHVRLCALRWDSEPSPILASALPVQPSTHAVFIHCIALLQGWVPHRLASSLPTKASAPTWSPQ